MKKRNKDYKSMYYYMAGQMVMSAEVLETATSALDGAVKSLESYGDTVDSFGDTVNSFKKTAATMVENLGKISGALTVLKDKFKSSQERMNEMFAEGEFGEEDDD
jgi:uncharacterized protein YukE